MKKKYETKLEQYPPDCLDYYIETAAKIDYPMSKSSVRKMYSAWLRNENDDRSFDDVFNLKKKKRLDKYKRAVADFEPKYVGFLDVDKENLHYEVTLLGMNKYKVSFLDPTMEKMMSAIEKFLNANSITMEFHNTEKEKFRYKLYTKLKL